MDPQLHKSLLQIKKYKGDVEDLCLDFTVSAGEMMGNKPIELFPGGASVNVTNSIAVQCRHFIHGFSKVCICRQLAPSCPFEDFAVLSDCTQVVPKEMLRMFNPEEMQVFFSLCRPWLLP